MLQKQCRMGPERKVSGRCKRKGPSHTERQTHQNSPWKLLKSKAWKDAFQVLKSLRLLYPMKLSIKTERETKPFYYKNRLKEYITRKSALWRILEGILQTEEKDINTPKRKRGKYTISEQLIKVSLRKHHKVNKITKINTHISNNDSEYEWFKFTSKKTRIQTGFKKQDPTFLLTLRNTPYSQRQITPQDGWGRCPKQKELGNKLV